MMIGFGSIRTVSWERLCWLSVIDRTVNGSSRFQFLQMLNQKVCLQRIRMIVVYRHSLLERDTILTAIVIVVV